MRPGVPPDLLAAMAGPLLGREAADAARLAETAARLAGILAIVWGDLTCPRVC